MKRVHHHPCQRCQAKTECGGEWEQNYDGFPEVICREFHLEGGVINRDFVCEACAAKEDVMIECHQCGRQEERDDATLTAVQDVRDDATGYQETIYECEVCHPTTQDRLDDLDAYIGGYDDQSKYGGN